MADSSALPLTERERDLLARTVYGEANGLSPRAQAAVVWAIRNRMATEGYPSDAAGVVLQRGQFEPWGSRRNELLNLPTNSRSYREALQTVDDVFGGSVPDITNGATNFYAPVAQAQFGRRPPKWAQGEPLASEGGHLFYRPGNPAQRPTVIAPPEPGVPATLEEAGIMPRGPASPSTPKASPMPDTSDDDLLALYGVGKPAKVSGTAKATSAKPSATATAAPAGDDGLSDDALLGLYMAPGAGKGAQPVARTAEPAPASRAPAMPLQSPDGIVDGNTGALVVAGKPFTDNTSGLWSGFNNLANGALLGAGVPLAAGAAALKEKLTNGGDLGNLYTQARAAYGGAQERFQRENPGTALATELGGSIPTTIAATALGGAALGAGGNALLDAVAGTRAAAPLASAGQFVTGAAGRAIPATAQAPAQAGNLLVRAMSQGTAGAAAGAFGGAINTGLTGGEVADNALMGGALGAGIGASLPAVGAAARGTLNRLTGSASPEVAQLARTAEGYGIPIRMGQISDSPAVRFMDSTLSRTPGMGYGAANRAQQTAVNQAVAQSFGETADRITPPVMRAAKARIGQTFDRVAAGSFVQADNEFVDALDQTFRAANSVLTPAEVTPLRNFVRDQVLPKFGTAGDIGGEEYQALTRKGAPLDRLMNSTNPNVKFYAGQIRDALDGALERSAAPELVDELRQARRQYKNLKTIEDLAGKSPTGDISPAGLMQAVQRSYGASVAYQGGGDLGDLARIGQRFLKEPPSSGTAERIAAKDALGTLAKAGQVASGAAGAAVGLNHFAPQIAAVAPGVLGPTAAGAAATFGAGRVASAFLRSPMLRNRLIDQALGTGQPGPVNRLLGTIGEGSYAPAAAAFNRTTAASSPGNDNSPSARLMEFLANRPRQQGARVN
ncbi:MAG TPA: cell wall hydrolase [Methylobacterium sp.]|jgi:hypothetical protein|nr:cell wall hydrolase [Methylobacterium sp.]